MNEAETLLKEYDQSIDGKTVDLICSLSNVEKYGIECVVRTYEILKQYPEIIEVLTGV